LLRGGLRPDYGFDDDHAARDPGPIGLPARVGGIHTGLPAQFAAVAAVAALALAVGGPGGRGVGGVAGGDGGPQLGLVALDLQHVIVAAGHDGGGRFFGHAVRRA
jgi:hypothetical protein